MTQINIYDDILYNYQKEAVCKLFPIDKHLAALDMGLGKTFFALSMLQFRFANMTKRKALVLCQKTKVEEWYEDLIKYFPDMTVIRLDQGTKAKQEKLLENAPDEVIIVSAYKTAQNRDGYLKLAFNADIEDAKQYPEQMVFVADESQKMKSRKSALGQWGEKVANQVKYVTLLSGDPISNTYEDLFQQMKILGMTMDWNQWNNLFCITEIQTRGSKMWPKITGFKNTELLFEALGYQSIFMKTEDVKELPQQIMQDVMLKGNVKAYKNLIQHRVLNEYEFEVSGTLHMACRQLASGFVKDIVDMSPHKKDALVDLLESTKDSFVIFYNFNQERDDILKVLDKMKIQAFEVSGRKNEYTISKTHEGRKVLVVQFQAGAEGLNLQDIHRTIYYSPTDKAGLYKQSLKRTHRVGQTQPCYYYRFITKGTTEPGTIKANELGVDYTDTMFASHVANFTAAVKKGGK